MTAWPPERRRATLAAALLITIGSALVWPLAAQAEEGYALEPYGARYAIYRNGKLTGKVEVALERHADRWIIRSEGSGTHGLARILAARDNEDVAGRLVDGRFRPDRYRRHTRVAGIDDRWTVDFDWERRRVSIVYDRHDPLLLDMSSPGIGDALDPLSLKLEMRHRLSGPEPQLQFQMVEEDEIDEQSFRILPPERMETSLGCLATIPVEKIRQGSTRYTRAWHAPDLAFVEVRVEHGKTDGNHLEMRITELTLDGVEVAPRPACAALQSAAETD